MSEKKGIYRGPPGTVPRAGDCSKQGRCGSDSYEAGSLQEKEQNQAGVYFNCAKQTRGQTPGPVRAYTRGAYSVCVCAYVCARVCAGCPGRGDVLVQPISEKQRGNRDPQISNKETNNPIKNGSGAQTDTSHHGF